MKIGDLINKNYPSVSVLEDMQQIAEWLKEKDDFVVIDEELHAIGVVTLKDVGRHTQNRLLIAICISLMYRQIKPYSKHLKPCAPPVPIF
jgi:hypothetical protein